MKLSDEEFFTLALALYGDLHQTYPSITPGYVREELSRQLEGMKPLGGPGVFIADALQRLAAVKRI